MNISLYRAVVFLVLASALTILSFHGALDGFAREQIAEMTTESIGLYVMSRGINAAVSVLQTAQVKLPLLASVEIGQMLDPVNDAVERLSSMLVWAVGSLFLQRILIEIVSSPAFKWTLFSLGAVTVSAVLLMQRERFRQRCRHIFTVSDAGLDRGRDWLVRAFILVVVLRFIVPLFVTAGFLVSQFFLQTEITGNKETLSVLGTQISAMGSSPSRGGEDLEKLKGREEAGLYELNESMASAREKKDQLDEAIDKLNEEAGWRRILPGRLGGVSPGEELAAKKQQREEVESKIKEIEDRIRDGRENLECVERRIAGETCDTFWETMSKAGRAGIAHVKEAFGKLNDMVMDITMLLIAVAIKNILFPMAFLAVAVKCSLPIVRHTSRLFSGFERDSAKLKDKMMHQLKGPER